MKKFYELINISGVSKEDMTFFDDHKLIEADQKIGPHKFYGDDVLWKIWKILVLKEMGYPLFEIIDFVDYNEATLNGLIEEREKELERRKERIEELLKVTRKIKESNLTDKATMEEVSEKETYKSVIKHLIDRL